MAAAGQLQLRLVPGAVGSASVQHRQEEPVQAALLGLRLNPPPLRGQRLMARPRTPRTNCHVTNSSPALKKRSRCTLQHPLTRAHRFFITFDVASAYALVGFVGSSIRHGAAVPRAQRLRQDARTVGGGRGAALHSRVCGRWPLMLAACCLWCASSLRYTSSLRHISSCAGSAKSAHWDHCETCPG